MPFSLSVSSLVRVQYLQGNFVCLMSKFSSVPNILLLLCGSILARWEYSPCYIRYSWQAMFIIHGISNRSLGSLHPSCEFTSKLRAIIRLICVFCENCLLISHSWLDEGQTFGPNLYLAVHNVHVSQFSRTMQICLIDVSDVPVCGISTTSHCVSIRVIYFLPVPLLLQIKSRLDGPTINSSSNVLRLPNARGSSTHLLQYART